MSPDDLLPPDVETEFETRPVTSESHLFALSQASDSVAIIDPTNLAIEAVDVAPDAVAIVPITGGALVLSRAGRAVTRIREMSGSPASTSRVKLSRRQNRLSLSTSGDFAVAWTSADEIPDAGAEGVVNVVDLRNDTSFEVAAGYRHTNFFFRKVGSSELAIACGKEEVVLFDLQGNEPQRRVRLPDSFAEVIGREIVAGQDSEHLLIRSFGEHGLGVLSVDSSTISVVPLPGIPTDLDFVESQNLAVSAIRASAQLALIELPGALSDPSKIRILDIPEVVPGQVQLSPDNTHAAVFSTQDNVERFGWVELATGNVRIIDRLKKLVREIGISPDGLSAVVLHRPNPQSTVADPYERAVDLDEGYSVVRLDSGDAQLKRTGAVAAKELVFSASGDSAGMTLRRDESGDRRFESIDLSTLIVNSYELASAPEFAGSFSSGAADYFWITQSHPAGRISFLDPVAKQLKTATGFQLNAEISSSK